MSLGFVLVTRSQPSRWLFQVICDLSWWHIKSLLCPARRCRCLVQKGMGKYTLTWKYQPLPSLKLTDRPWKSLSFLVNTITMLEFSSPAMLVYRSFHCFHLWGWIFLKPFTPLETNIALSQLILIGWCLFSISVGRLDSWPQDFVTARYLST